MLRGQDLSLPIQYCILHQGTYHNECQRYFSNVYPGAMTAIWCLVRTWLKCPTVILDIDTFSTNWYLLYFVTFLYERKMKIFLRGCQHFIELLYLSNLPILSMIYARHWWKWRARDLPVCHICRMWPNLALLQHVCWMWYSIHLKLHCNKNSMST